MTERPLTDSEIAAMLHLLEDPDEEVQEAVWTRLRSVGRRAVPLLREARSEVDEVVRPRLDTLIHDLHFEQIEQMWTSVMQEENALERGAFLLALYRFPELDVSQYQRVLDEWTVSARGHLTGTSGSERALALSHFFVDELGFAGNRERYYDPNNSYLSSVMSERQGIPISLSVLYLLLARRLDLPVHGVNMPAHFLVKYEDDRTEVFIDLFNEGRQTTRDENVRFLMEAGITPQPEYFAGATDQVILLRMVRNLLGIAHQTQQKQLREDMEHLLRPFLPVS